MGGNHWGSGRLEFNRAEVPNPGWTLNSPMELLKTYSGLGQFETSWIEFSRTGGGALVFFVLYSKYWITLKSRQYWEQYHTFQWNILIRLSVDHTLAAWALVIIYWLCIIVIWRTKKFTQIEKISNIPWFAETLLAVTWILF